MRNRLLMVFAFAVFVMTLLVAAPAWAVPNLSITKEGPARVEPGAVFVYTVVVRNTGADPANGVVVTDRLPEGVTFLTSTPAGCTAAADTSGRQVVTCTVGTLASGARQEYELRVQAPSDSGEIENRATVDSTDTDAVNSTPVTTLVASRLAITKRDDPDPLRERGLLQYTLRVTNEGNRTANDVVVLDDLPEDVEFEDVRSDDFTCVEDGGLIRCDGTLANGESGTVDILVEPERDGTIENTARVRSGRVVVDSATQQTTVEERNTNPPPVTNPPTVTNPGDSNNNTETTTAEVTTAQTTTPETTTADAQTEDLTADADRAAAEFRCAEIVEISQSASRNQYNFSAARLQECLAREVIDDVKGERLAETGGPPLFPIAAFVLIGAGIFLGRAILSRRDG